MHDKMEQAITDGFLTFKEPLFESVGNDFFTVVKQEALNVTNAHYAEDCIKLCKFIMPELQITLDRQCKDYGVSEEYSPQNPIDEKICQHW